MGYILKLPYRQAFRLVNKARQQNGDDRLFQLYSALYPNMNDKSFMTFEEYRDKCMGISSGKMDTRSKEEIMQEIMEIKKKFSIKS